VKLLGPNREAVRRERSQENAVETLSDVFVDDLFDAIQARLGGCHQCTDSVWAETFLDACNTCSSEFVAVLATPRSIAVVEIARSVQRSTEQDAMLSAKVEHLVTEQG
jgi:hypothetical protein